MPRYGKGMTKANIRAHVYIYIHIHIYICIGGRRVAAGHLFSSFPLSWVFGFRIVGSCHLACRFTTGDSNLVGSLLVSVQNHSESSLLLDFWNFNKCLLSFVGFP